jgi:hypothetical protein
MRKFLAVAVTAAVAAASVAGISAVIVVADTLGANAAPSQQPITVGGPGSPECIKATDVTKAAQAKLDAAEIKLGSVSLPSGSPIPGHLIEWIQDYRAATADAVNVDTDKFLMNLAGVCTSRTFTPFPINVGGSPG